MLRSSSRKQLLLILMTVISCLIWNHPTSADEIIKIGGTGSGIGTMKLIGEVFHKTNPDVAVEVLPSLGSSGGIKAVSKNVLDISISSRSLRDEEKKMELVSLTYARTPLIPVAHNDVKVSELQTGELIQMYSGKTITWPDGEYIRLILRPASETDTAIVKGLSQGLSKAVDAAMSRVGMLNAVTDQENALLLQKTPGSFGFMTFTQVQTENISVRILTLNGVAAKKESSINKSYPLFKILSLVTLRNPLPKVRKFLAFIWSPQGRRILEDSGNIPVEEAASK